MGRLGSTFFGELRFGQETSRFYRTSTVHSDGIFAGSDRVLSLNRQAAAWAELFILETARTDDNVRRAEAYASALYADATRDPIEKSRVGTVWKARSRTRTTADLGLNRSPTTLVNSVEAVNSRVADFPRSTTAYSVSSESTTNRTLTVPRAADTPVAALYADSTRAPYTKSRGASMFASPAQVIADRDQQLSPRQAETYVQKTITGASGSLKLIRQSQFFLNGSWTESDRQFIFAEPAGQFGRNQFGGIRFGQQRTVRDGKHRTPETYTDPIETVTSRTLDLPRATRVFTEFFEATTDGFVSKPRLANTFAQALVIEAVRSPLAYDRSTMTFVERAFTRATADLGLNRSPTSVVDPVQAINDRVNDHQRDPVVHTPGVQADTGRALDLNRLADVYLTPLLTNAERAGIAFNRATTTYLNTLVSDVSRALTTERFPTSFTDALAANSGRAATLRANATSFTSPVQTVADRDGVVFGREANVWVETLLDEAVRDGIGFDRTSNTYTKTMWVEQPRAIIAFTRTSNTFAQAMFRASDRKFIHLDDGEFGTARFGQAVFGDTTVEQDGKKRGAETFITIIDQGATRELTVRANPSTFVEALRADTARTLSLPRLGRAFFDRARVRATGDLGLERQPTTIVDPLNADYTRVLDFPRATNTYVQPVWINGDVYYLRRAASFMETVENASERQLSLQALANVYSEMVLTNAGGTLTLDRAAATFLKATIADIGRTVEKPRETVVHIEDVQALVDRVLERSRNTNVWIGPAQMETDAGAPHWIINGLQVQELVEEVRTWNSMTLTFRSDKTTVKDRLRPLFDRPGKVDVVDEIDGGFRAVNRAGPSNQLDTQAPFGRGEARPVDSWYVNGYSEEVVGRDGTSWEVEVELTPEKEKAHDNEYGTLDEEYREERTGDRWKFAFEYGDIVTRRVTTELERSPEGTVVGAEIQLVLTQDELCRLEESAGKLAATNLREIPDGADLMEDVTADDRNTVAVTPPDGSEETLAPGAYVISEFETTYNRGAYVVALSIKQT